MALSRKVTAPVSKPSGDHPATLLWEHSVGDGSQANTMTIPARYENGVFRPLDAVKIGEGTVVEVYVPAEPAARRARSVRDFAFCGMWKDREEMADSAAYVNRRPENLQS
jgi:predicted DNA-binding antitoxin AbrB/MazE fold protein